jgi:hypothetical protein
MLLMKSEEELFSFLFVGVRIPLAWLRQPMESGHWQLPRSQPSTGAWDRKGIPCVQRGKSRKRAGKMVRGWVHLKRMGWPRDVRLFAEQYVRWCEMAIPRLPSFFSTFY